MKKTLFLISLLAVILFLGAGSAQNSRDLSALSPEPLQVKIGNDTTFCAEGMGHEWELAPNLTVTGGTPPYQYCWSIPSPYEYLPGRFYYASKMMNDTTLAQPLLGTRYVIDPGLWAQFILTVKDDNGDVAEDRINVRFSEFYIFIDDAIYYSINEGDSILFDMSGYYGGIFPYTAYSWEPKDGLSDPDSSRTWCKPSGKGEYYYGCIITDSVGCSKFVGQVHDVRVLPIAVEAADIKNAVYQTNGTIFFDNPENRTVKLSFYDLSGKLCHSGVTTANSYRPNLPQTGSAILCEVTINGVQQTIKYITP